MDESAPPGAGRRASLYLLPELPEPDRPLRCAKARRAALVDAAMADAGLPFVEDNPYGELWFDAAAAARR